jgi:CheY-like chemotaxis protein
MTQAPTPFACPILIVDDDQDIREILRDLLQETGYIVLEAADGVDALVSLQAATHPMVVLLDLFMPYLDGSQVVEIVLDDPQLARRHTFIFMSARYQALPPGLTHLLELAGVPVIAKPFDFDELLDIVHAAARRLTS